MNPRYNRPMVWDGPRAPGPVPMMGNPQELPWYGGLMGHIGTDGRYLPDAGEIKTSGPKAPCFYRRPKSKGDITISQICRVAYGKDNTANGVMRVCASTWNRHIKYTTKGFEYLGVEGPHHRPVYSDDPRAKPNTGKYYPVLWLPPLTGPISPEDHYGVIPTPVPPNGGAVIGPPGPMGPPGESIVGPRGPKGGKGDTGPPGIPGVPGAASMVPGPRGITGKTGSRGAPGAKGDQGIPGSPGSASDAAIEAAVLAYLEANPPTGTPGERGPPGESVIGPPGPMGPPGDSVIGPRGPRGYPGAAGSGVVATDKEKTGFGTGAVVIGVLSAVAKAAGG